jgi:16S rRNA (uracil1498-N3)-methyltransferase
MPDAPRLFHAEGLAAGAVVTLSEGAHRHIQALRLAAGDAVTLFAGDGWEWPAELVQVGKRLSVAKLRPAQMRDRESPLAVTLVQGICAADRMDWVVQKATELGVSAIRPIVTQRTIIRLSSERQERREQHWQAIAVSACEQCGRNRVPTVHPGLGLADFLAIEPPPEAPPGLRIMLLPGAERRLADLVPQGVVPTGPLSVAIGPEGGFTDLEESLLASRGYQAVRLGPRTLRTETAPLAALAVMQSLWGDL